MTEISIDEAQVKLSQLLENLAPGEEVVITQNNQPLGRLVGLAEPKKRLLGTMRGQVTYMAPDFNAPLNDFKDYVE
jgi:prevent-host-death family protein